MSWSKINKPFKKPLKWWYHKILCEFWYWGDTKLNHPNALANYYNHLEGMCGQGFNLYGNPWDNSKPENL